MRRFDGTLDPLVALRRGDRQPFEDFVRSEAATFVRFFRRQGAAREEAEDLCQELFVKLFRAARSYVPSERFAAFAFRIARNAWIDRERRRATRGTATAAGENDPDEAVSSAQCSAPEELGRREDASALARAIEGLSPRHRLVFDLAVVEELSYDEIARVLDVPVGTVKSRMFYAVRHLRAAVGATAGSDDDGRATSQEHFA